MNTTHEEIIASLPTHRKERIKRKAERLKKAAKASELIDLAKPQQGASSTMRAYFADVPPPKASEENFILPEREVYLPLEL